MSSTSSGVAHDPSASAEDGLFGPFITVVSVDGGLQCGNKLTVITPTEISETAKQGKQAVIRKLDTSHDKAASHLPTKLTHPSGDFGKANLNRTSSANNNNGNRSISPPSKVQQKNKASEESGTSTAGNSACSGAAYVTVLALSEEQSSHDTGKIKPKSGIPVRAEPSSLSSKKSFVNICSNSSTSTAAKGPTPSFLPTAAAAASNATSSENGAIVPQKVGAGEDEQVVTIGNKAALTKGKETSHIHQVKNASIVEITMKECNNDNSSKRNLEMNNNASPNENDVAKKVREPVVVYRLPGERLGFALKFDGGTASATEKVNHLFIQSCAEGSPAKRTCTSWGHLGEGDEIVEIENVAVNSLTRMDCVQALKDSSVAVRLTIEHTYTEEELKFLRQQMENNAADAVKSVSENGKIEKSKHSGIPTFHKSSKESRLKEPSSIYKEAYQKSSHAAQTCNSEKGIISKGPNQRVTNPNDAESMQSKGLTFTDAFSYAKSDASEIKFDEEEMDTGRNNSKIPIKRGHTTSSSSSASSQGKLTTDSFECNGSSNHAFASVKEEERLDELKLQPPVGFEDELHSQQHLHFSLGQSNYYEGENKSEQIPAIFANDRHYKANEANNEKFNDSSAEEDIAFAGLTGNQSHGLQQPDSMPISNTASGSTNGNALQTLQHHHPLMSSTGSSTSLHNAQGFVHLSGNENLSISTCCESDETESTRSTVVSRLSIGSSMTSISAVMAVSGCCSDSNNSAVTLTQISECSNSNQAQLGPNMKRRSSPNSSVSSNYNVAMGLEDLISSFSESHGLEENVGPHHYQHEADLQHHLQPLGQQVQHRSLNNVTAIPYSSSVPRSCCREGPAVAEVPLEPPLSFQDKQEQVNRRRRDASVSSPVDGLAAEDKMQTFSNISAANGPTPPFYSQLDSLAENSNDANEVGGPGLLMSRATNNAYKTCNQNQQAQSHHHRQGINNQNAGADGSRKDRFANNDSFNSESNFNTGNGFGGTITDGNNNNVEEMFDDDELALLADELGLDQEDEDLFKAMLAEVEGAEDELEEYGPLILSSTPDDLSLVSRQGPVIKPGFDQHRVTNRNNVLIDDAKQGKSYCESNHQETVVSAKLGTTTRTGCATNHASVNDNNRGNNNIITKRNDDDATVRRITNLQSHESASGSRLTAKANSNSFPATATHSFDAESWTISNSHDNRDVRGLRRMAMAADELQRNGGENSAAVRGKSEEVKCDNSSALKAEGRGIELRKAAKTNDFCASHVTGSSDNKELIDEVSNGKFESSSDLQQQQLPLELRNKSHQHTLHLQKQKLQEPPAGPLFYHKVACKQENEYKNGTILLQNEKVVEPIMDKRFDERNQVVLLTSQQETSVTSKARDDHDGGNAETGVLRVLNIHRMNNDTTAFNLDNEKDDLTNTARITASKSIVSSKITQDHTDNNDDAVVAASTRSHIAQVKMLSQESSSKTTLFVAGLPVASSNEQGRDHQEKLAAARLSCTEDVNRGLEANDYGQQTPPHPPRRTKGSDRRTTQDENESSLKLQGGIQRSNQEVSKNSTEARGGTGEQAVEKIKRNEKLVTSDVHSTARHNSLKPGLSDVNCGSGGGVANHFSSREASTAKGSISNVEVINNQEGITEITDNNKNYHGKTNSSRIHVQGAAVASTSTSGGFVIASSSSTVSSVTSSLVKNSSELTAFGDPTRKNVDSNQQTGDDRNSSNSSKSSSSCPQQTSSSGTTQLESTLSDAGCRSTSAAAEVVVVVAGGKQESLSYLLKDSFSEEQSKTLLSSAQSSSSLVVGAGASTASSSSLLPSTSPQQKEKQAQVLPQEALSSPANRAGSSVPDTCAPSQGTMDSSTEVLHQYIPPTFSRLPPDGDEFPNSWSDEQTRKFDSRKVYRSELNLKEADVEGTPPPLPTAPPPVEDSSSLSTEDLNTSTPAPPLPGSMPPLPPKPLASRQSSIDDKRKLFESCSTAITNGNKPPLQFRNGTSGTSMISTSNCSSNTNSPPTISRSTGLNAEPSKKSVKDKIAMFSSRTSSSEDSATDFPASKPPTGVMITSSLKKSHISSNPLSRSSDNILQGLTMSASTMPGNENGNGYRGISSLSKINRSSLDISMSAGGVNANSPTGRQSSVDLANYNSKPSPFYGSLNGSSEIRSSTLGRGSSGGASHKHQYENGMSNGNGDVFSPGKVLYERSQSLIDVGGPGGGANNNFRNSYHTESTISVNQNGGSPTSNRYNSSTLNKINRPSSVSVAANSIMEQRRKCMTKLKGLVIPDVLPTDVVAQVATNNSTASVVDLPTIISKDTTGIIPQVLGVTTKASLAGNYSASNGITKNHISRSESLDGISSSDDNSSLQFSATASPVLSSASYHSSNSAKMRAGQVESPSSDVPDWKITTNALPKYSPAFKRRSLTAYQASKTSILGAPQPYKSATSTTTSSVTASTNNTNNVTPEPKSLESLTSPRSDSSFEFNGSAPVTCDTKSNSKSYQPVPHRRTSFDKPAGTENYQSQKNDQTQATVEESNAEKVSPTQNNVANKGKFEKNGKLDDSDNDSAVSSSRSSISHGLSPPNSPTPGESSTTPDPDNGGDKDACTKEGGSGDPSDESWRILKAQSIEAINRKNVLTSAKFSSGGTQAVGDDSSISSNGKNRRSDDEEASYADAETEDTESSCSELEVSKTRRRMIVTGRVNLSQRRDSKADTEEEDYEELEEVTPAHLQTVQLHSQQNAVDLGDDLVLPGLTESPLQAIYDMEVKMAYINEVCDALPGSGRSESASRYFSRRDSEATVIERPIEPKRKLSMDLIDSAAERRARNRSSSGNESDFSSGISQKSTLSRSSREREQKPEADRWSLLEKKYSRSLTAVNLVAGGKTNEPIALSTTLTPAASVPKIVTGASEIVEKKIEKIIEKSVTDGLSKKITNANIPRGRNDFKSLAEKWQQISGDGKSGAPPPVGPKPSLSRQNSTSSSCSVIAAPTANTKNRLDAENVESVVTPPPETKESSTPVSRPRPTLTQKPTSPVNSSTVSNVLEAIEADAAWAEQRRSDKTKTSSTRLVKSPNPEPVQMAQTKRSVSVNDIRKAFEKAESAISPYGRDDNSQCIKKDPSALTLPSSSAHFRVSSFDSTTSEESSATTPAGIYGSVNSLVSSAPRDPYGSITSLASSTSLISPQELQQLIDEANQSLEEAGTPSHEVNVVILHREFVGGSLGITLAGGADYETKEITVHKVITGSIADRDARVYRGDRVLSINGKSTKGLTHREALNLLKAPRTEVVLVVSRGRTSSNGFKTIDETSVTLDRAVEPLLNGSLSSLLENDDDINYKWGPTRHVSLIKDGAGLGFSLEGGKGSIIGDKPLTVKKIFIGGPAEKSGEMKVGDLIVCISGVNMSTKSRTEAWNFMKKLGDGEVKLTVRTPIL